MASAFEAPGPVPPGPVSATEQAAERAEPPRSASSRLDDDYGALLSAAEATLDAVDRALARLDDGTYGTCEACGEPIADDVLAASPTASTCERHLRPSGSAA